MDRSSETRMLSVGRFGPFWPDHFLQANLSLLIWGTHPAPNSQGTQSDEEDFRGPTGSARSPQPVQLLNSPRLECGRILLSPLFPFVAIGNPIVPALYPSSAPRCACASRTDLRGGGLCASSFDPSSAPKRSR